MHATAGCTCLYSNQGKGILYFSVLKTKNKPGYMSLHTGEQATGELLAMRSITVLFVGIKKVTETYYTIPAGPDRLQPVARLP